VVHRLGKIVVGSAHENIVVLRLSGSRCTEIPGVDLRGRLSNSLNCIATATDLFRLSIQKPRGSDSSAAPCRLRRVRVGARTLSVAPAKNPKIAAGSSLVHSSALVTYRIYLLWGSSLSAQGTLDFHTTREEAQNGYPTTHVTFKTANTNRVHFMPPMLRVLPEKTNSGSVL